MEPLLLKGCRHDILGHYLKAIGLLRVLARCADKQDCDPDAEGWWDLDRGWFCLRSQKYATAEKLVQFLKEHYRPTPVFSPWNTGGGLDEKKEVLFTIAPSPWQEYWGQHRAALLAHGFPEPKDDATPELPDKGFDLRLSTCTLPPNENLEVQIAHSKGKRQRAKVFIRWSAFARKRFFTQLEDQRPILEEAIKFTDAVKKKFAEGEETFRFDIKEEGAFANLKPMIGVRWEVRVKETGKKAVIALIEKETKVERETKDIPEILKALHLGRRFFDRFQAENADPQTLLEELRDESPARAAESFDSIFTTRAGSRAIDNPLFLNRGDAGNGEVFRSFWVFWRETLSNADRTASESLFGARRLLPSGDEASPTPARGKGTPFFPDAVKAYNIGSGWVEENYPFNALDYVLAVEGAYAMRGAVARTLAAQSKRFAAFPFVFDAGEDLVDDANEVKGTASALWFPLWNRPVTFSELSSFIADAQARLPDKEARFSAEFVRALHVQGVDAGFAGWQEFRFKMKASRVPWITTGRYVEAHFCGEATRVNQALAPLDESRFLDQFDIKWKGGKAAAGSPHPVRATINTAMEVAVQEPSAENGLALLETVFSACRRLAVSKSFRAKLPGKRATFFRPLPVSEWDRILRPLADQREFRIARAIASLSGLEAQQNGDRSVVQPMLGSILPLRLGWSGWYLPEKSEDQSHQAVWLGSDLSRDLAAVLYRRYSDSLNDDQPALRGVWGAKLEDVLAFLRGELDDLHIARWTEAISLIGWQTSSDESDTGPHEDGLDPTGRSDEWEPIPLAYAALRTLLELESEWQGADWRQWKKRRSQQPIALTLQRSASSLPLAVSEALRWIAIWGVRNHWGRKPQEENPRLAGRDVVRLRPDQLSFAHRLDQQLASRLAAAVCIPLRGDDRWKLYRAVTLPPST